MCLVGDCGEYTGVGGSEDRHSFVCNPPQEVRTRSRRGVERTTCLRDAGLLAAKQIMCKTPSPTMAQTHMQGPLKVSSHGPASKAEIANVRAKLQALLAKYPEVSNALNAMKTAVLTETDNLLKLAADALLKEPQRAFLEPESATWRFGAPPDYTLANYAYLTGKTKNHTEGSLELIVENLVKTWEMERSHKLDPATHKSVDQEAFAISANGGKVYNNVEANKVPKAAICAASL
eukprot:1913237-Pleurochrysis_carterae.AAC.5